MSKALIGPVVVSLLLSVSAFSQGKRGGGPGIGAPRCKKIDSPAEARICARLDYTRADAEMKKAYEQLMSELSADNVSAREKLGEAQSLWLKYREAACESEASIYEGGSLYPLLYYPCLASVSRERTKRLKAYLSNLRNL